MTVSLTSFRANIRQHFEQANETPVAIHRNSRVYVLMSKEHYVDLINKTRMPNLMQMPQGVQTIVHFTTQTTTSQ